MAEETSSSCCMRFHVKCSLNTNTLAFHLCSALWIFLLLFFFHFFHRLFLGWLITLFPFYFIQSILPDSMIHHHTVLFNAFVRRSFVFCAFECQLFFLIFSFVLCFFYFNFKTTDFELKALEKYKNL